MNIFISQSGELSRKISEIFGEWIKSYFSDVNIFISSKTIDGGEAWFQGIVRNLKSSNFAISILTKENHSKPWINYEYGVLVENSKIIPILFDISPNELSGEPIQQYQCVRFDEKEKVKRVFLEINKLNGGGKNVELLDKTFNVDYEKYKTNINNLINYKKETKAETQKSIPKKINITFADAMPKETDPIPEFLNKLPKR
ncbi:MAG: TIR domain-containing protein [Fibromonadales bacterium]|nr:TIR domain-containing protein [Fibromonadales bacterium]